MSLWDVLVCFFAEEGYRRLMEIHWRTEVLPRALAYNPAWHVANILGNLMQGGPGK